MLTGDTRVLPVAQAPGEKEVKLQSRTHWGPRASPGSASLQPTAHSSSPEAGQPCAKAALGGRAKV